MKAAAHRSIRSKLNVILATTTLAALLLAAAALLVVDLRRELATRREDLVTQADVVALASAAALAFADREGRRARTCACCAPSRAWWRRPCTTSEGRLFASYRGRASRRLRRCRCARRRPASTFDGDWATAWRPVMLQSRAGRQRLRCRCGTTLLRQALEYIGLLALIMAGSLVGGAAAVQPAAARR